VSGVCSVSKKYSRQEAISSLHPAIRKPVADILETLHGEGHRFEVFEAWRTPHLQQKYYSKGRNRAGKIVNKSKVVTYARPWRSFHQYGLAVDLVLKTSRGWSWNDRGANAKKWKRMHEVAKEHGMVPLKFEKPHIQIDTVSKSSELYVGKYPSGGDDKWAQKLRDEIVSWSGSPAAPPLPDMPIDRPPVADVPGGAERETSSAPPILTGQQAYPQIIEKIFEVEGGYVNHPSDPGGPTNMGITLATLSAWRGKRVTARDVKNLSKKEAADIYEHNYFNKVNASVMPACVAMHVFNTAVLSGPKRGGQMVQKALNALGESVDVDGVIGPQTMGAIFDVDEAALADEHLNQFLGYLRRLSHWSKFGRGWTNRMNNIHSLASELAQTPPPPQPENAESGAPASASSANTQVTAYLFKGLFGDIFSDGLDDLADKLETSGIQASVHHRSERARIEDEIRNRHRQGTLGSVVLIGHSLGANAALRISNNLAGENIDIAYLATLDPTISKPVGAALKADNFRSRDIRDKPIPGANEIARDDLSHIELDNDVRVHQHILSVCSDLKTAGAQTNQETVMSDNDQTRSGAGGLGSRATNNPELDALVTALMARLGGGSSGGVDISDGIDRSEILDVIRIISGRKNIGDDNASEDANNPMTPINSLFGNGPISRFLNGKKTTIGIFGLLGTYILPILFPQAAPLVALFNGMGIENVVTEQGNEGSQLLTGIFSAFAAWGGLGKLEKWTRRLERGR